MKSVRKMVLVPYDKYEHWKQNRHFTPLTDRYTEREAEPTPLIERHTEREAAQSSYEPAPLKLSDDIILATIPKNYKGKAKALLHFIHHSTDISWNNLGEIIIQNKVIPHSHVTDLVKDTVGNYKTLNPVGKNQFLEILVRNNIPKSLFHYTHQYGSGTNAQSTPHPPPGLPLKKNKPEKLKWVKF